MINNEEVNDMKQEIRRIWVMLEHIDSKTDTLVDGLSILDRKIDRYHDETEERFSRLEAAAG